MRIYKNFIGGSWTEPARGKYFETANPFDSVSWARIPQCDAADVDHAVAAAKSAFQAGPWATMRPTERGAALRRIGDAIGRNVDRLAEVETRDNGKLLVETRAMIRYVPQWYYYYAGLADKVEGSTFPVDRPDMHAFSKYEPLGVIAALIPWNSPLFNGALKFAPILAGGNTLVIKPSEFASASTLELIAVLEEAALPPGVVNVITGLGTEVGAALVAHPDIAKISFTGGEATAMKIAAAAAKTLVPTLFELGGKSANIVFADANLENATKGVVAGIFAGCGQSCVAGSRALVARPIYDEFIHRLTSYVSNIRMGDPMDLSTQYGPLANQPHKDRVLRYIEIGRAEGANLVHGGKVPASETLAQGLFVEPTIFRDVRNSMRIAQEEIFGPVLSVIPFDEEEEAIAIANDVSFGLAGGIWTSNIGRAMRVFNRVRAGTIWINTYRAISFMVPFGGMKRSGFGRENGQDAIREFMHTKSCFLSYAASEPEPFVIR